MPASAGETDPDIVDDPAPPYEPPPQYALQKDCSREATVTAQVVTQTPLN